MAKLQLILHKISISVIQPLQRIKVIFFAQTYF
jgi:hypothetical protein